jgi:hypothetical protein
MGNYTGVALNSRFKQNTTEIPQKLQIVTDNIQTLCLFVGDRWTDAQTAGQLLNIQG